MATTLQKTTEASKYSNEIKSVLKDSIPVLLRMVLKYGGPDMLHAFHRPNMDPLTTKYTYSFRATGFNTDDQSFLVALWT